MRARAAHYYQRPGETLIDGLTVTLAALFFALAVRRTGNLWFAIGWHFTFNYGSMFVFGFPNTGNHGQPIDGRLLNGATSGGHMGAEASIFMVAAMLLQLALIARRFPRKQFPAE